VEADYDELGLDLLFGDENMDTSEVAVNLEDDDLLLSPKVDEGIEPEVVSPRGSPPLDLPVEPEAPPEPEVEPVVVAPPPVVVPAVPPVVATPGFFRLKGDCSNALPVGAPRPRAVLYKAHNITDPRRIQLALCFARNFKRIPAEVLTGDTAALDRLSQRARESLSRPNPARPPQRETVPGPQEAKSRRPRKRKRSLKCPADGGLSPADDFESLYNREKAVNHQAHTEINRLNRELGKEKVRSKH